MEITNPTTVLVESVSWRGTNADALHGPGGYETLFLENGIS